MADRPNYPLASIWERLDLFPARISLIGTLLYSSVASIFRGPTGAKFYDVHLVNSLIRKAITRMSFRQIQYLTNTTSKEYGDLMKKKGLRPETVKLADGANGHWIGNKDAKNVIVYYHGGGFAMSAFTNHFTYLYALHQALVQGNHDVAFFFIEYTLTPHTVYPTQLRQAVEALRYILIETERSPSNVILGGDSAGGNLALTVLLHISHPHPDIETLKVEDPLLGVFGFAPWVDFSREGSSMEGNVYRDLLTRDSLKKWSDSYLDGKEGDYWSEPARAPLEWWEGAKTDQVLLLTGSGEMLFSGIEKFANKFKTVFPNTTIVVGEGETHVAPIYSDVGRETQTGAALKDWLMDRL